METAMMNGMCRCCASEGVFKDIKTTYTWMGAEEIYADMLKECFDINVSESDNGEDGGICEVCITQLRNASNFKKQVLNTEEQFKNYIQSKIFKSSMVKVELMDDPIESDDNNLSADETYSGAEYEVPIKKEDEEAKPKKRKAAAEATTSRTKKSKAEVGESSTKRRPQADSATVNSGENLPDKTNHKGINVKIKKPSLATHEMYKPEVKNIELYKHRSNIREVIICSNATPIRRYGGMGYTCCYCDSHYLEATDLKKHTLETHHDVQKASFMKSVSMDQYLIRLDITSLKCKLCDMNPDTLEQFMKHLKVDHQKKIYTDIKNHIIPFKFITDTPQCCICLNTFSKFKTLLEHMNLLHYRNYICDICGTGFVNSQGLKSHKFTHDTGTFKCDHCPQVFDTQVKKKSHERSMHSLKPKLKCAYCSENFPDYRRKEAHLVSMHGLKVPTPKCHACDKIFSTRQQLNTHIKRSHLMDRRHKCSECDMSFFQTTELKYHMVKHTGVKSVKCTVCAKAFCSTKTLREHMKIHDDIRRYKCEHCGQTFVQKCSWRGHMKSKHDEIV